MERFHWCLWDGKRQYCWKYITYDFWQLKHELFFRDAFPQLFCQFKICCDVCYCCTSICEVTKGFGPQTIGFHQPSQSFGPVGNGRDQHRSGGHATWQCTHSPLGTQVATLELSCPTRILSFRLTFSSFPRINFSRRSGSIPPSFVSLLSHCGRLPEGDSNSPPWVLQICALPTQPWLPPQTEGVKVRGFDVRPLFGAEIYF